MYWLQFKLDTFDIFPKFKTDLLKTICGKIK